MTNIFDLNAYKDSKDELEQSYLEFTSIWNKHFNTTQNLTGIESFRRMYCALRLLESELMFSKIFCGEYFEREKIKKMMQDFADSI